MIAALALSFVLAQQMQMGQSAQNPPPALRTGLGDVHHPVNTKNKLAQKFFDQGLALCYGFNHHAAIEDFQEAANLDPNLAMAHWGIAYATGMNINMPIDAPTNKAAYAEAEKAIALEDHATPEEKDLIDALAQRYNNDDNPDFTKLNQAYSDAMGAFVKKWPDDLDAQVLYAESIMDMHPWRYWKMDGTPIDGTETVVSTLQGVIAKSPNHIGANHFFIHAVEASPHPELGLDAARKLGKLAPQSGHLVHMPSHIYLRMGMWDQGIKANEAALAVDKSFLDKTPNPGVYPMYYVHNFDMYRACADMGGNYEKSLWAANNVAEKSSMMGPMGEPFSVEPWLEMVRFCRWNDILNIATPTSQSPYVLSDFHYARGMAFASTDKLDDAQKEFDAFTDLRGKISSDYVYGFTPASQIFEVQADLLGARMMKARSDHSAEIDLLNKAVAAYDQIDYDEPADFYFPVRESLGFALLRANRFADAAAVFQTEVKKHPHNGRALYGLWQSLRMTGPLTAADQAKSDYEKSWKLADTQLNTDGL